MLTRTTYRLACCLAAAVVCAAMTGCKEDQPPQEEAAAQKAPAAEKQPAAEKTVAVPKVEGLTKEVAAEMQVDVEARLAKADAVDGTVDKVVSKCPACRLAMDGNSENSLEVSGYKLHFCTEQCKAKYAKDPTQAVLAMEIPKD